MRVKMASVSASTLTPRTNNTLHCTLHTFASQANDAAIALYTITQLCSSRFGSTGIQRDIAHSFLRVAGVLSSLLTTCDLDFLPEIVRLHLNTHAERCQPLLQRVDSAIGKLHAHYEVSERRGERVSESFGAFGRDAEREVADHLEQFFNMALRVRLRWSTIEPAKFGDRNPCICDHTQQVPFDSLECLLHRVDKELLGRPLSLFETLPLTLNRQSGLFGAVQQNSSQTQRSSQPSTQPQTTCSWFNHKSTGTVEGGSTSVTNPAVHVPETTVPKTRSIFRKSPSTDHPFGWKPVDNNPFSAWKAATGLGICEHLEAYILCPHAESSKESITWSNQVKTLPLDSAAMEAHITKLGPTYSVIDAISLLQPQQLHLVQEHVKFRNGKLVSMQFGTAADLPTPSGSSVRTSSVIFLLKTAAAEKEEVVPQSRVQYPRWGVNFNPAEQSDSLFGNNVNAAASNTGGFGSNNDHSKSTLFGGFGTNLGDQPKSSFGNNFTTTTTGTGLFGSTHNPPKPSLFGGNPPANTGGGLFARPHNNWASSPGDELCTIEEHADSSGTVKQRFMVLPAYFEQSDKSFEEARAQDIQNGIIYKPATAEKPQSLFGMSALKNSFRSAVAPDGDEAGVSPSQAPASTALFGGGGQKAAISEESTAFGARTAPFASSAKEASNPAPSISPSTFPNPRLNPFATSTIPTKLPPNSWANISLSPHATAAGFGQGLFSSALGVQRNSESPTKPFSSIQCDQNPASTPSLFGTSASTNPPTSSPSPATHGQALPRGASPTQLVPHTKSDIESVPAPSLSGVGTSPSPSQNTHAQPLVNQATIQVLPSTNPAPDHVSTPSSCAADASPKPMTSKPTVPSFAPSAPLTLDVSSTPTSRIIMVNAEMSELLVEAHKARMGAASASETELVEKGGEGEGEG